MSKNKKSEKAKEPGKEKDKPKEKKKALAVVEGKKPAVRKKTSPKLPATPAAPAEPAVSVAALAFTTEDISLRAYYLAENRRARGEHGDEASDWIEAERQLRAEGAQ